MSNEDEFQKADEEAGVETAVMEVMSPADSAISRTMPADDIIGFRKQLIEEYHRGAHGLLDLLHKEGKHDLESRASALLDEMVRETDNLLGNELMATRNGDLRDSTIISFKRLEGLEKTARITQAKQQFEKQGGIDLDSPLMIVIFTYFLMKSKETFNQMGVGSEINDLFFQKFGEVTVDWKKELREKLEASRAFR